MAIEYYNQLLLILLFGLQLSDITKSFINLVWLFCRCREKQRKEASHLQTFNRKLSAMNKLLMEENDRLQRQVSNLVYDNGYMRQHLNTVSLICPIDYLDFILNFHLP